MNYKELIPMIVMPLMPALIAMLIMLMIRNMFLCAAHWRTYYRNTTTTRICKRRLLRLAQYYEDRMMLAGYFTYLIALSLSLGSWLQVW